MSTAKAVARGTTRLLAGLLAAKVLDFAFYLVLARRLGVEEFGRYTYAMSFTVLFTVLADVGVMTLFTREVSRTPERVNALLRQVLRIKLVLAALTFAASTLISWATHPSPDGMLLIAVLTAAMLFNSSAFLFENLLKSAERAGVAGISVVAQSASAFVVGSMLVFSGLGALGGAWAYLVAAMVHLAAAAYWSRDLWRRPDTADAATAVTPWPTWIALVKEAMPMALSWAFLTVYFRIDTVLLNVFQGPNAVGLYGGCYRFFEAFVLLSAAYRSVLFPVMARAADGPDDALGVLCRKSLRLHLMFTIGVAVFITFQARQVLTVMLGSAYAPAAPVLATLVWALPGAFMADTLLHLLAAQRRQSVIARAMGITAFFNVALNLAVIPRFSAVGAAATTVASELLIFALMFFAFSRRVRTGNLITVARAPLIAGAVAAGAMMLLSGLSPGGIAGLVLMATFAISAYLLALVALGALGRQDAELVVEVLPSALKPLLTERRRAS
jgi:O-antigen/teichoic acid export membrane protein